MLKDERDLLDVLKFELYFLSKGGYQQSSMEDWRPKFIFEDSPTCMNYHAQHNRGPCSACVLMNLVPFKRRFAQVPCRLIPVNSESETLDDLYRYSDQNEIEKTVGRWLKDTIEHLEIQRAAAQSDHTTTNSSGESLIGTPLYQNLHPKCANPACPTAFHWTGGGKFFRFRPDPAVLAGPGEKVQPGSTSKESSGEGHGVKHYWLCEKCCRVFTLAQGQDDSVVVNLLWTELPDRLASAAEVSDKKSAAASAG